MFLYNVSLAPYHFHEIISSETYKENLQKQCTALAMTDGDIFQHDLAKYNNSNVVKKFSNECDSVLIRKFFQHQFH